MLADRRIQVELTPEAREWLAERGYDPVYGARPLRRIIQKHILNPLSREMLKVPCGVVVVRPCTPSILTTAVCVVYAG